MNLDILDLALDAIAEAKREIIRTEATDANRKALNDAYAGMVQPERAIGAIDPTGQMTAFSLGLMCATGENIEIEYRRSWGTACRSFSGAM